MNPKLSEEIQAEQNHGRTKYGLGPNDFAQDDATPDIKWTDYMRRHLDYAEQALPMERRQQLIKIAGLCVSAVESFDRKREERK